MPPSEERTGADAAAVARAHAGFVAWPTLFLSAGVLIGHLGSWLAVAWGLPLWLGAAVNTLLAYLAFTPLHEAAHGNVGGSRKRDWLDRAVGWPMALLLGAPFPTFQLLHLRHHTHTNDPEKDPDFWVAGGGPFAVVARCWTIVPHYYATIWKLRGEWKVRAILPGTVATLATMAVAAGALVAAGWGAQLLFLWLVPAWLASGLLALLLDWLPHHPHARRGRFVDTRAIVGPGLELLTLGQSLHVVHHLHPHVVFYRYGSVFRALRHDLERHGVHVVDVLPRATDAAPHVTAAIARGRPRS